MSARRDLQFVRLACRRQWLTAEEGEACLVAARRLGHRVPIEEVIRRQGYLDEAALSALVDEIEPPRRAPAPPRREQTVVRAFPGRGSNRRAPTRPRPPSEAPGLLLFEASFEDDEERDARAARPASVIDEPVLPRSRPEPADTDPSGRVYEEPELPFASRPPTGFGGPPADDKTRFDPIPAALRDHDPAEAPSFEDADAPTPELGAPAPLDPAFLAPVSQAETVVAPVPPPTKRPPTGSVPVGEDATALPPELLHTGEVEVAPSGAATGYAGALSDADAERLLGPFGPYRLERIIGASARSVVYLGRPDDGGDPVAVEVLRAPMEDNARWLEAQGDALLAGATLEGAGIIRVRDVGRVDARHYVALDHVDGWSVQDRVAAMGPLAPQEAIRVVQDAATALAGAHAAGVVHGAIGPEWVVLGPNGRARVAGFGFHATEGRGPSDDVRALASVLDRVTDPAAVASLRAWLEGPETPTAQAVAASTPVSAATPTAPAARVWPQVILTTAGLFAVVALVVAVLEPDPEAIFWASSVAAAGLALGSLLAATLGLIRRGQLPLPGSSAWLVNAAELASLAGTGGLLVAAGLAPPAGLTLLAGGSAAVLLVSASVGLVLRRVSARRVGERVLAQLSDPAVVVWGVVHAPLLATGTALAVARFAAVSYFS